MIKQTFRISEKTLIEVINHSSRNFVDEGQESPMSLTLIGQHAHNCDGDCSVSIVFDEIVPLIDVLSTIADDLGLSY